MPTPRVKHTQLALRSRAPAAPVRPPLPEPGFSKLQVVPASGLPRQDAVSRRRVRPPPAPPIAAAQRHAPWALAPEARRTDRGPAPPPLRQYRRDAGRWPERL